MLSKPEQRKSHKMCSLISLNSKEGSADEAMSAHKRDKTHSIHGYILEMVSEEISHLPRTAISLTWRSGDFGRLHLQHNWNHRGRCEEETETENSGGFSLPFFLNVPGKQNPANIENVPDVPQNTTLFESWGLKGEPIFLILVWAETINIKQGFFQNRQQKLKTELHPNIRILHHSMKH